MLKSKLKSKSLSLSLSEPRSNRAIRSSDHGSLRRPVTDLDRFQVDLSRRRSYSTGHHRIILAKRSGLPISLEIIGSCR
jgi:hypothetical protein